MKQEIKPDLRQEKEHRCSAIIPIVGGYGQYRCTRKGKYTEAGQDGHYCKTHLPSNVRKRREESSRQQREKHEKFWMPSKIGHLVIDGKIDEAMQLAEEYRRMCL